MSSSSQGDRRRSSSASNSTPNESKTSRTLKKVNANTDKNIQPESGERSPKASNNKIKPNSTSTTKGQQQTKNVPRKPSIYSSDDDTPPTKAEQAEAKRIQNEIKKKTLVPQALKKSGAPVTVPSTGGKAPPAVVKQHQQMNKSLAAKNAAANRSSHVNKNSGNIKRKSVFSPINSSESEEEPTKKQISPTKLKPPTQRGRPKKVVEKELAKSSESSTASSTETTSSRYVKFMVWVTSLQGNTDSFVRK